MSKFCPAWQCPCGALYYRREKDWKKSGVFPGDVMPRGMPRGVCQVCGEEHHNPMYLVRTTALRIKPWWDPFSFCRKPLWIGAIEAGDDLTVLKEE